MMREIPQNANERELLSLIKNSKDPANAILRAYALITAIATDEAFYQKIQELHEKGDEQGERELVDSTIAKILEKENVRK